MSFLKVGGPPPKTKSRLYILQIVLPSGMTVIKIGKASGASSKERMMQICGSIYDKFRTTPMIKICRDREVDSDLVFKYEAMLHRFFKDCKYESKTRWDGITECFAVPLEDAIQAYEAVIEGHEPDFTYILPEQLTEDELPF